MAKTITLPNEWDARWYQEEFLSAMDGGLRRALLIWCRRSGKDSTCLNFTANETHKRIGGYYYMLPTQKQARKVVWNGIDKIGRRIIDQAFPKELRKRTLEDEMLIEFKNGSMFQVVGSDAYDALVGTNPVGLVGSEWALSNPRSYDYLRPILVENGGWFVANSTPRGKNHLYTLYQLVKTLPDWFVSIKTAADTGHISLEDIDKERLSGMSEDRIQQEFYCSFDATTIGLIYDSYVQALETAGRLCSVPYDPRFPVETAWDIGRDGTSIWFVQRIGGDVNLIDFHDDRGKNFPHYAGVIHKKPYVYSRHIFPHDMNRDEFGSGNTRIEMARQHGLEVTIAPKLGIEEGITATRALFPRLRIDTTSCGHGIRALRSYRYDNDSEDQDDSSTVTMSAKPLHDWASHPCDALRYLAVTPEWQGIKPQWIIDDMKRMQGVARAPDWPPKQPMQHVDRWSPPGPQGLDAYDPLEAFRQKQH